MSRRTGQRVCGDRRPDTNSAGITVRDTGLKVRAARRSHRRSPYPLMTAAIAVIGIAAIAWMVGWGNMTPTEESTPTIASASPVSLEPEREPTPVFAQEGATRLHLAVDPGQLTALGFHQAAGSNALHLASLVPDADMALAAELKAVPPVDAGDNRSDDVWAGTCLRMWRSSRTGEPDTAVDMGADPGTSVWAPVSGTVTEIRPYLLYDKYEDFEIHIKPDGRDDIDLVLIHVQDVTVSPGDRVFGGATRIATVRKMSDKIDIQLGGYTSNGGDHVHLQINRIQVPGELEQAGGS